jgi:branched-chain amino acid transport system substrate-binding protein
MAIRHSLLILAVFQLSSLLFLTVVYAERSAETCIKKLKIGISLPLTAGPISSGNAVKNGIILADEKYDHGNCVEFLFDDDQLLAKNTINVVSRFIDTTKVDGLIIYGTPTSMAAADIVEKHAVPTIALTIHPKVVAGRKFIVKHWCTASRMNDAVVAKVKDLKYRRVAIVTMQNDAMLLQRDLFRSSGVVEITSDDEFARDDFDFSSVILKIIRQKPDAIYNLLFPPQMAPFMKRLREQGYKGEAFAVHNGEDLAEVKTSAGAMVGMWLANGQDEGEDFKGSYLSRFGLTPALGGASGFDAAKMYIEAAKSTEKLNEYLHSIRDFHGAFGTYSGTNANDFDFPAVIKRIASDGFVVEAR